MSIYNAMVKAMREGIKFKICDNEFIYHEKRFYNQHGEWVHWADMLWLSSQYPSYQPEIIEKIA